MKTTKIIILTALLILGFASQATAQVSLGADAVSRYVWRGWDFGNAASIQPALAYTKGAFEVGAWGSFSIVDGSANENDLYVSYSTGPVSVVVTDYFFPGYYGNDGLGYYEDNGAHIIEAGASYASGPLSLSGFFNVSGFDTNNSMYFEVGYTPSYSVEGVELGLFLGAGNEIYTTDGDFMVTNIGVTASKENISVSYIVNPDQETTFLVFGYSF